jgi:ferredoxin
MNPHLRIAFFSGTGNARFVANTLANRIKSINPSRAVELIDIGKLSQDDITGNDEHTDSLVLVYPTHGFNAPPIVYQWLSGHRLRGKDAYLINTRGGLRLMGWNISGVSGIALLYPAFRLWQSGASIKGMASVDLPSNWMSLHPAIRESTTKKLVQSWTPKIEAFADRIEKGQRIGRIGWFTPVDIILSPIAILYYFMGRFALAKSFYASSDCDQCGLCIDNCPVKAITWRDGRPYWTLQCESCMKCMSHCPKKAIQTPHLWLFLIWIVFFGFVGKWTVMLVNPFGFQAVWNEILVLLTITCTSFPFIYLTYRLFHFLNGKKGWNHLGTLLSPTSKGFWGRYKGPMKRR